LKDQLRRRKRRAWREFLYAARFLAVGGIATLTHLTVALSLIHLLIMHPMVANTLAFLTAFGLSFAGNYYWTFGEPGNLRATMHRFLLVSSSAFAVNTILLAALISTGWLTPLDATLLAALVIPALTFTASRWWAFRPK
jgi:putative flippase GtrA